jgi:hypothetical protein
MSSTYSSNLALELIGGGEQAGNWGSTTNTNLGTLIEQAISGYTTQAITDGADTVITIPNGASGVARNMFIECTGTLTGARNLIVPANRKIYYIYNNTSGGYAVTVKVSGQTGISVPNGAKVTLVSNGTDIIAANNYVNTALTGVPTAPTASVGTNTTQIATTAFVQAAATPISSIYPVGSIYISTVGTNPSVLFGFGTWVAFAAGRVLIGDGGGYSAGATGGSADAVVVSHNHTATSTSTVTDPGHTHTPGSISTSNINSGTSNGGSVQTAGAIPSAVTGVTVATSTTVNSAGVSGTNANLQPYIVVYMWNRTA